MSSTQRECPGCGRPIAHHGATVKGPDVPAKLRPCGTTVNAQVLAEVDCDYHNVAAAAQQDVHAPRGRPIRDGMLIYDEAKELDRDDGAWLYSEIVLTREECL